ncbi:MAG: hypothetical protein KAS32_29165 [Candidatus Peribacteraceae bacterium]|nr:hypothetical protein [Candidatus Peribacteraceae bacterium]
MTTKKLCGMMVSDKERSLIELLRDTKFGQAVVFLENGQPVRIEKIKESIKL